MLKEAIDCLLSRGQSTVPIHTVFENQKYVEKLIVMPGAESEIRRYDKTLESHSHNFFTIDGFINYLLDMAKFISTADDAFNDIYRGNGSIPVFVSQRHVSCDFWYHSVHSWTARSAMFWSPEILSLEECNKISQGQLWERLATTLNGRIDQALSLIVSEIQVSEERTEKSDIEISGLRRSNVGDVIKITFPGVGKTQDKQEKILQLDWEYTGPLYRNFLDHDVKIPLRLLIKKNPQGGILFSLVQQNFERVVQEELAFIANYLREKIDSVFANDSNFEGITNPYSVHLGE